MRLSVIIPTIWRPTLARAVASCKGADEVLVIDGTADKDYGGAARNRGMAAATGDYFMFLDDDDAYVDGGIDMVRQELEEQPDRVHVFAMTGVKAERVEQGCIGTPMFVVPCDPVGEWTSRYEGDFDFINSTMNVRGDEPVFHRELLCLIRPE